MSANLRTSERMAATSGQVSIARSKAFRSASERSSGSPTIIHANRREDSGRAAFREESFEVFLRIELTYLPGVVGAGSLLLCLAHCRTRP